MNLHLKSYTFEWRCNWNIIATLLITHQYKILQSLRVVLIVFSLSVSNRLILINLTSLIMEEPKWRRNNLNPAVRFIEKFECQLELDASEKISVVTIQSKERHSGLWDAAVVLAAYVSHNRSIFQGRSVVEVICI
jgi:hypothetical protein